MRVALVVQRYGKEVIGGAESHARLVAEQLVRSKGWQVEVFTTTAGDYETWAPRYPVGSESLAGVTVHRFPCRWRRIPWLFKAFNRLAAPLLGAGHDEAPRPLASLRSLLENLWFILQGPYCPSLITALQARAGDFTKVFFFTYLYYPTVYGLPHLQAKAVLIPTAHPEAPLYFPRSLKALAAAPVHLLNSQAEEDLLASLRPPLRAKFLRAGVGIPSPTPSSPKTPQEAQPYLLYLGRVSKGKGVDQLLKHFLGHLDQQPMGKPSLHLLIAGAHDPSLALPQHPSIRYLGVVAEEAKTQLIARAYGVVNPSPLESLSLIVLEALGAGTPVLVNSHSPVLASYTRFCTTVFSYGSQREFSAQLMALELAKGTSQWQAQIRDAQRWVEGEYGWPKVLAAYEKALYL